MDTTIVRKPVQNEIVIVDDDKDMLELVSLQLKKAGYQVFGFDNPNVALGYITRYPPLIMILDLNMPGTGGLKLLAKINKALGGDTPPCLVLSSEDEEASIEEAYEAGACEYVRKPFARGELAAKVKRVVRQSLHRSRRVDAPAPDRLGGYQLLHEIGQGGSAAVFQARKLEGGELRAVKIMRSRAHSTEHLLRFQREFDLLALLDHPHLAKVYESGQQGGWVYYAMEWIKGRPLSGLLTDQRRYDAATVCDLLTRIAETLTYLHGRQVLHRDIKPGNIMIRDDGHLFLVDFGLAKVFLDTQVTLTADVVGTPRYMAPEVIQGRAAGPSCDLFSLGLVALEMITGERAVEGDTPYTTMFKLSVGDYRRLRGHPEAPPELAGLIDAMIEPDPDKRPISAAEVAGQARALQEQLPEGLGLIKGLARGRGRPPTLRRPPASG